MPGKNAEQLHQKPDTGEQIPVLADELPHHIPDFFIGIALVIQLGERTISQGKQISHLDIPIHLFEIDLDHVHDTFAKAYDVGMNRIGRDHKQLLPLQRETVVVDNDLSRQIIAEQYLNGLGIVQGNDILGLEPLDLDGIGHLGRKKELLLEAIGQPVIVINTLHKFPYFLLEDSLSAIYSIQEISKFYNIFSKD